MTATIIKAGGALSVAAVSPRAYKTYKERVYDNGGVIVNESDCAAAFAFLAKYGYTTGTVVSPKWGVRTHDGFAEKFFGLLGNDISDPYTPLTNTPDVVLDTYETRTAAQLTTTATLPASSTFAVSASVVSMVAVRSQNANTATEGYLIVKGTGADAAYRMSVSNAATGGSSRLRVECGPSIRTQVFGATKAALARWKVSGLYASAAALQAIEDGAVFASAVPGANFKATTYEARLGFDATNGGAYGSNTADCRVGEAWVIPEASAAFALALAAKLRTAYGEP